MKTTKRKNKTYENKLTKYRQQEKTKQTLFAALLALTFAGAFFSALTYIKITNTTPTTPATTPAPAPVILIELKTNNYEQEVIIREAARAACLKHDAPSFTTLDACINDLVAIAYVETQEDSFNCSMPGNDSYDSLGCFQISRYYHPEITDSQALDPFFSADWTLARMINNGYKTNRDHAIRRHNGGINWRTAQYLTKVNNFINN